MASEPINPTTKKIGAIYSWLIRQPADFAAGVSSVADAEKLFDNHLKNISDTHGGTLPHKLK